MTQRIVICIRASQFFLSRKAFHRLRELGNAVAVAETDYGERYDGGLGSKRDVLGDAFCRIIPRNDTDLLTVIDEMGQEAAGTGCKLGIAEVPDDVDWEVVADDGFEWIAEKHRTWEGEAV